MNLNNDQTVYDYLIIGAGPAGVQLGYYLEKAGRNYLILEAGTAPATFFKKFPRHRKLISINKVFTGYDDPEIQLRWDWNSLLSDNPDLRLKHYSKRYFPDADDFVTYLDDFVQHFKLQVKYGVQVRQISKDGLFTVKDGTGQMYSCHRLIVATGVSRPNIPAIPGIELAESYFDVSVDPDDFAGERVLIIGKGNSAFETAENLIETASSIHLCSPHSIKMAWQTHFVGHLRAINNSILDTYQLKSQNALLDATIQSIERHDDHFSVSVQYSHANNEQETLIYDRVIYCTGFCFDTTIFDETCRPELAINNRFPKQTSQWESTNIKDLFFAGVLMQMRDYQKTTSAFIHGFRYNVQALHYILESKYYDQPWPATRIAYSPEALTDLVIRSINRSSALWQQFGFLGDLAIVDEGKKEIRYYEGVPVDYIKESAWEREDHYYVITLEYGEDHVFANPFNVQRIARDDVANAQMSHFLHPIIRHYSRSTVVNEHHVIEDLAAEWLEDVHIQPLLQYFCEELLERQVMT